MLALAPAAQANVEINTDDAVGINAGDSTDDVTLSYGVVPGAFSYRVNVPAPQQVFVGDTDMQTACTKNSPQQVTCQRTDGGRANIRVLLNAGNDAFEVVGRHTVGGTNLPELTVNAGDGDDTIRVRNDDVENVICGNGADTVFSDFPVDSYTMADCEDINPDVCYGNDCYPGGSGENPPPPNWLAPDGPGSGGATPATLVAGSLKVRGGQTLEGALKGGFKFKLKTTASAKVAAKLTVAKQYTKKYGLGKKAVVVAKGSKTVGPQGGTVRLVFTQKAKRALSKVRSSLRAKLSVTVAGELAATEGVKLNTPKRRRFGGA